MIVLVAALLSLVLVGTFIQLAPRYSWGKEIRQDGPESHHAKAGTPTMGGAAFLLAALFTWLFFGSPGVDSLAVALLTLAVALLGLYDDLTALRRKRPVTDLKPPEAAATPAGNVAGSTTGNIAGNVRVTRVTKVKDATTGVLARYRLLVQAAAALPFAIYAVRNGQELFGPALLDTLGFAFIIVGTINALNFSDGLDGLAGGMAAIILLPFIGVSFVGALIGALLGFLWFNAPPARVFMGGVGSEALGAAIAGTAILAGWGWWLPLIALLPLLEVLSVMIQVPYFKFTGGKRFFKMTPLHHHFEKSGWPEQQVTLRFWLLTAVCVALAWGLKGGLR
jgi:phospho-N-acetylmuramoyl-pentapeptide-transferase